MILTTGMLLEDLGAYASPKTKLSRMVQKGEIFKITKGLYETDSKVPAHLLAGSIYGPSYISFEFALSYYSMIPEAVYTVTSATFEKKKKKRYETRFGSFSYRDVPSEAFPLFVKTIKEGDYWFRIALPEKAICDELYSLKSVASIKELEEMMFQDMRIDVNELMKLDRDIIDKLHLKYHSTNVKKFNLFMRRLRQ